MAGVSSHHKVESAADSLVLDIYMSSNPQMEPRSARVHIIEDILFGKDRLYGSDLWRASGASTNLIQKRVTCEHRTRG